MANLAAIGCRALHGTQVFDESRALDGSGCRYQVPSRFRGRSNGKRVVSGLHVRGWVGKKPCRRFVRRGFCKIPARTIFYCLDTSLIFEAIVCGPFQGGMGGRKPTVLPSKKINLRAIHRGWAMLYTSMLYSCLVFECPPTVNGEVLSFP